MAISKESQREKRPIRPVTWPWYFSMEKWEQQICTWQFLPPGDGGKWLANQSERLICSPVLVDGEVFCLFDHLMQIHFSEPLVRWSQHVGLPTILEAAKHGFLQPLCSNMLETHVLDGWTTDGKYFSFSMQIFHGTTNTTDNWIPTPATTPANHNIFVQCHLIVKYKQQPTKPSTNLQEV